MRRAETGTERRRSWWLELFASDRTRAEEFIKSHAVKVADVMTTAVVTATEDASLGEIATLLERHGIKRVPIVRGDKVVGIVSRANLLQAFASTSVAERATSIGDRELREQVMDHIRAQPWGMPWLMTVSVHDGVVELWGPVSSEEQRRTIRVAAESTPGVREIKDNLILWPVGAAT
jgi:CBS-domain-containing membrane protein